MNLKSKKLFLALTVIVPFLGYCLYYYGMMVSNAPYKYAEFKSIVFEYGNGDSLLNKYNSKTREYQFVNDRDSVVKRSLKLTSDDLLFLHRKAADLGFWNFPAVEVNEPNGKRDPKIPYYKIQFNYKRKSKTVLFEADFKGDAKLKDANERLIKEIQRMISIAENRDKK